MRENLDPDLKALEIARITPRGAILIMNEVACDAHQPGVPIRVVTHAHSDHMIGLRRSLASCKEVVATPATKDLLMVLKGSMASRVRALSYGERLELERGVLRLEPADHILGAAQVVYETADGTRIVYTGDFRLPRTPVIEADLLIIEATYGHPSMIRPPLDLVIDEFVQFVRRALELGPVNIFAYHGKMQEAMELLRGALIDEPFLVERRAWRVTQVAAAHGMRVGEVLPIDSEEGQEVMRSGRYIAFYHALRMGRVRAEGVNIYLTGWEFRGIIRRVGPRDFVVALSDHADFKQLLEYVEEAKPRVVIVDASRSPYAGIFAKEVRRRLGIEALPSPG